MRPGWQTVALEQIAASQRNALVGGPFGSNLVTSDYVASGVPVIRGQNMGNGRWVSGEFAYVSPEKAASLTPNLARPGDLIFTQRGTLGQVAIVPANRCEAYVISQSQMKLTPDPSKADVLFLYYLFKAPDQQKHILNSAIQTGVPHTNLTILKQTKLTLPPLRDQQTIARLLGILDDKIELNRRMNETLEAIARARFKSWFIDFDPVRTNADDGNSSLPREVASPFPSSFKPSELGKIPAEWTTTSLASVCTRITDGSHTSPKSVEAGRPMASVKDMHDWGIDLTSCRHISEQDYEQLVRADCRPLPGDVLIAKDGSYLKHIFVVDSDLDVVLLSSIAILRPNERIDSQLLAFALKSQTTMDRMEQYVSGAVLPRIVLKDFRQFKIVLPPRNIQRAWKAATDPLLKRCYRNIAENGTLAAIRDAILPKLLSGQIRITEAENMIGAAV